MELGFTVDRARIKRDSDAPKGLLVRKLGISNWNAWDGGICGGAGPIWLYPPSVDELTRIETCDKCKAKMTFILQIYAPIDEIDGAFHRDLCVYFCNACRLARCVRAQLPRVNDFYAADSTEEENYEFIDESDEKRMAVYVESEYGVKYEDDEEDDEEEEEEEGDETSKVKTSQGCKVCGAPTTTRCSACKSVYYCECFSFVFD